MYEEVQVLTHSSIKINGSRVMYFDPFEIAEEAHDADMIMITHDHFDHYSPEDIQKIMKQETMLIAPECMRKQVDQDFGGTLDCIYLAPGASVAAGGITIQAVPAYNRMKPFHPKGKKYAGYVAKDGGTTYYIAGDTDVTSENQQIKCDVALVPVGGKFTMDYKDAATLVNQIKPKLAIPTHYGKVAGSPEDGKRFAELAAEGIEVRVQI